MAKLQYIKKQIDLIKQIQHVTRTMKIISAVRWRMGKRTLDEARRFSEYLLHLNEMIQLHLPTHLLRPHPPRGFAVIGIFSDKGLVGGFNSVLASKINTFIDNQEHEGNKSHIIILGTQGISLFKKKAPDILLTHPLPIHQVPHYQDVRDLIYRIRMFHEEKYFSHLFIAYNQYLSVSEYRPVIQRIIPVPIQNVYITPEHRDTLRESIDIMSPSPSLEKRLSFEFIASQVYVFLIESFISEQATRFKIMDAATSHSDEMINSMRVLYQKKRQEKITQEINEVTNASQVLGTI